MKWMLMPLRRYADFSGRSRRKEYWMYFLGIVLLYTVLAFLLVASSGMAILAGDEELATSPTALLGMGAVGIVMMVVWLGLLIPSLAVGVRRLHDIDRTGLWLLLPYGSWILSIVMIGVSGSLAAMLTLLSYIGWIVIFIFALLEGTKGPNRFGDDPKGPDHADVFA